MKLVSYLGLFALISGTTALVAEKRDTVTVDITVSGLSSDDTVAAGAGHEAPLDVHAENSEASLTKQGKKRMRILRNCTHGTYYCGSTLLNIGSSFPFFPCLPFSV